MAANDRNKEEMNQTSESMGISNQFTLNKTNNNVSNNNNINNNETAWKSNHDQNQNQTSPSDENILKNQPEAKSSNDHDESDENDDEPHTLVSGLNLHGQLSFASDQDHVDLTRNPRMDGMALKQIGCGLHHSVFLTLSGSLLSCGLNDALQLGREGRQRIITKLGTEIFLGVSFSRISVGDAHCVAVSSTGVAWAFGANQCGQLGLGTTTPSPSPQIIADVKKFEISNCGAGANHSFLVAKTGQVFSFGMNSSGQLGTGDTENRTYPRPLQKIAGLPVSQIAAGREHSLLLTAGGSVYVMGSNRVGQCGLGNEETLLMVPRRLRALPEGIQQIAAGHSHSLFLDFNGVVYSCGNSANGQTGTGVLDQNQYAPAALKWDPATLSLSSQSSSSPAKNAVATAITANGNQSFVQLGLPEAESGAHVLVFGQNNHHQLLPTKQGILATPTPLVLPQRPAFMASGAFHTFIHFGQTAEPTETLYRLNLS